LSLLPFLVAVPAAAGVLVDPGGVIESIVADPSRNVFYATLETNEVVVVTTGGAVSNRVTVAGDPDVLAVARNGSALYVALEDSHDVAVYDLPGLTFRATWNLSTASTGPTGLAERAGRLYAVANDGLSIVDTATGTELYFGQPPGGPGGGYFYSSGAVLSPNGRRLYSLDRGLSPASLIVFDVATDAPVYAGEEGCHGCIGSNGRQAALSPDGALLYVAVGGQYHLQVLGAEPILHDRHAGLTGPYPNAIAVAANGARVYVGYQSEEFAVVRTSDWLPFHVGALQGDLSAEGLALAQNQTTLAAVIEYQGFDPNRIELVDVASPVANRGGLRVRPVDSVTGVPLPSSSLSGPGENSAFVDVRAGRLARAPAPAGAGAFNLSASGYTAQALNATIAAGAWTDLGDVPLVRTGPPQDPQEVSASPAAFVGATTTIEVHGRGFLEGVTLEPAIPEIAVDSYARVDWATVRATLTVGASATPGRSFGLRLANPGGTLAGLPMMLKANLFADGFETGDDSHWSASVP